MSVPAAGGGREDCWSEGATASLVEAWGDRYLLLNRGNLRQKDWSDVANAVNAYQELLSRPRKTDVQCKNRIDTVKKKYKSERAKSGPSTWHFFAKLDFFVANGNGNGNANGNGNGNGTSAAVRKHCDLRLPALTFPVKRRNPTSVSNTIINPNFNPNPSLVGGGGFSGGSSSRSRMFSQSTSQASSESSRGYENDDEEDQEEEEEDDERDERVNGGVKSEKSKWEGLVEPGGGGVGELVRAIAKFAEVYERVESEKQKQVMEMERQRMEFAKEVEFERMKLFLEAQLEVDKMKRPKYSSGSVSRKVQSH